MLDLFFRVLSQSGNAEEAYNAVVNEVNKRRLGVKEGDLNYEEALRMLERVVDVSKRLDRLRSVFGD